MNQSTKWLVPLSLFYLTVKIITLILLYKIVILGSVITTASSLIIPLWFVTGDIIAEIYGYQCSKNIIWSALICQFILSFSCALMIQLPSPLWWHYQSAYDQVLGKLPRIAISSFIGISVSALINAKLLTKWKILLYGRHFWLRSFFASAIGEFIFVIIAISMEFYGVLTLNAVLKLILSSYFLKLLINLIMVVPATFLTIIIKNIESVTGPEKRKESLMLTPTQQDIPFTP